MIGSITGAPKISNLFQIDDMVIAIICDASHVLKLIRNMLQNKGMIKISKEFQELWEMITDEVRWEVIEELVKFQEKFVIFSFDFENGTAAMQ